MPAATRVEKVSTRTRRRIRISYFCLHIVCTIAGVSLLATAYSSQKAEQESVSFLNLNVTKALAVLFYVVGGAILASTVVGVLGMVLENGYLWIIYSMFMAIVCLTAVAGAGSALDQQEGAIRREMRTLIGRYKDNQKLEPEVNAKVDLFQTRFKCCGIDNYSNWQDVEFGRTSLRVPESCCKEIDDSGNVKDEFCGHLCLPFHVNMTKIIYTEGCFEKMASSVRLNIILLGIFGIFAFLLTGFMFALTCYLIISKKMDTH